MLMAVGSSFADKVGESIVGQVLEGSFAFTREGQVGYQTFGVSINTKSCAMSNKSPEFLN